MTEIKPNLRAETCGTDVTLSMLLRLKDLRQESNEG
jgi:hypothetical protein